MEMSASSSSHSPSFGPFSLVEFGHLVALALEIDNDQFDRFSDSLQMQLDPDLPLTPSKRNRDCDPFQLKSTLFTPPDSLLPSRRFLSNMSYRIRVRSSPSRPRQLINKLKRQASALVLRSTNEDDMVEVEENSHPFQPIPTFSPYSDSIRRCSSFFDAPDEDNDDFVPYLPLVAQYERAATATPTNSATKRTHSIFSRPPSSITTPSSTPTPPSSPASVRSVSSNSTTSTTTEPLSPITPTSLNFSASTRRWSRDTEDSFYPRHPFAQPYFDSDSGPNEATPFDPFAKGSVQVVTHPEPTPIYRYRTPSASSSSSAWSHSRNAASHQKRNIPPTTPPPNIPLPPPPSPTSSHGDGECDVDGEWTLHLGVPLQSPLMGIPKVKTHAPGCRPRISHTDPLPLPSQLNVSSKPKPKQKATKPTGLRINVDAARTQVQPQVKKPDWTLSLPLPSPARSKFAPPSESRIDNTTLHPPQSAFATTGCLWHATTPPISTSPPTAPTSAPAQLSHFPLPPPLRLQHIHPRLVQNLNAPARTGGQNNYQGKAKICHRRRQREREAEDPLNPPRIGTADSSATVTPSQRGGLCAEIRVTEECDSEQDQRVEYQTTGTPSSPSHSPSPSSFLSAHTALTSFSGVSFAALEKGNNIWWSGASESSGSAMDGESVMSGTYYSARESFLSMDVEADEGV